MSVFDEKPNYETVNILEAKESLLQATKLYFAVDEKVKKPVATRRNRPICFMGPAGIGKTEIVHQVADELGLALCSYSLVHHTRQSLLGLPRLEETEWQGKTVCCTHYTMSEIIAEIHKIMEETGGKQGILFLDEFNCASESIRPVMLQLLQEKALGTHKIPEGWMLVLSGNPPQYNKSAKDLDPVTLDRVRLLHVEPDLRVWLNYAKESGVHPVVLSFLEENPHYFSRYEGGKGQNNKELVTPRGWEDLSIQIKLMEEIDAPITPAFIGQYFQSSDVIHKFHNYFKRFAVINRTGLMQRISGRDLTAIDELKAMDVQSRWAVVSSLINRIESLAEKVISDEETVEHFYNLLKENADTLKGGATKAIDLLNDIADDLFTEVNVQKELLACAKTMGSDGDSWETIKEFFNKELLEPSKKSRKEAITQIENMLFICHESLTDAENLERLLHSIINHYSVATLIASSDIPSFQSICMSIGFEGSEILKNMEKEAS